MTCNEAGRMGAEKRRQLEREPILRKAMEMRAAMNLPPHPGLALTLTLSDQLKGAR